MKARKTKFNEVIINRDFTTNSRELTFAKKKLNKSVTMVKQIFLFIFGSGWCNQASNMNSKVM
jgi:hypothetical protein